MTDKEHLKIANWNIFREGNSYGVVDDPDPDLRFPDIQAAIRRAEAILKKEI